MKPHTIKRILFSLLLAIALMAGEVASLLEAANGGFVEPDHDLLRARRGEREHRVPRAQHLARATCQ